MLVFENDFETILSGRQPPFTSVRHAVLEVPYLPKRSRDYFIGVRYPYVTGCPLTFLDSRTVVNKTMLDNDLRDLYLLDIPDF